MACVISQQTRACMGNKTKDHSIKGNAVINELISSSLYCNLNWIAMHTKIQVSLK